MQRQANAGVIRHITLVGIAHRTHILTAARTVCGIPSALLAAVLPVGPACLWRERAETEPNQTVASEPGPGRCMGVRATMFPAVPHGRWQ